MQYVGLYGLIMGHCIFGILHQIIPDNDLVHGFHNLTSGLVGFYNYGFNFDFFIKIFILFWK